MIWLLAILACGDPALPTQKDPCSAWKKPGTYTLSLDVSGRKRTATVVVPKSKGPRDLVVALHGRKGTSDAMASATEYGELAAKKGFVVAFPQGVGGYRKAAWNAGSCCDQAQEDNVPDVAFLDALVDELGERTCTDRVLAAGFSNGSAMAQRWACESDSVDAIVAAGAPMMFDGACTRRPVPIHYFHGTKDPVVPIEGSKDGELDIPPAVETFERWKKHNQCRGKPKKTRIGDMSCQTWSCAQPTRICVIEDWKHRWPGGPMASDCGYDATAESLKLLDSRAGRKK